MEGGGLIYSEGKSLHRARQFLHFMFIPRDPLIPNCVDVELMVAGPDTVRTPLAGQNNGPDRGVIGLGPKLLLPIHSGPEKGQYLDKGVCCDLGGGD